MGVAVVPELNSPFEYSGLKRLTIKSVIAIPTKSEDKTMEALNRTEGTCH